jgi:hypothetical protein
MATVLHTGPSDHKGYTHFIVLEPIHGEVKADNGHQGVITVGGHPGGMTVPPSGDRREENIGEPGSVLLLCGQREFHLPEPIKSVSFPDGSTWKPSKP